VAIDLQLAGRRVSDADALIRQFESCALETGRDYLDYPCWEPDRVVPEDLAVTLAMNSLATGMAFRTLARHSEEMTAALAGVPKDVHLASASREVFDAVTEAVVVMTGAGRNEATRRAAGLEPLANGVGVSVATKLLHKKRPGLIRILDNQAIFRDYLGVGEPPAGRRGRSSVSMALEAIQADLARAENVMEWQTLEATFPRRTRLQLLDMAWWIHNQRTWFASGARKPRKCSDATGASCPAGCPAQDRLPSRPAPAP
jgi:hypothetical protein